MTEYLQPGDAADRDNRREPPSGGGEFPEPILLQESDFLPGQDVAATGSSERGLRSGEQQGSGVDCGFRISDCGLSSESAIRNPQSAIHRLFSPLPGPGLPEAAVWTVGVLLAQVICGAVMAVFLVFAKAVGSPDLQSFLHDVEFSEEETVVLMAGAYLMFALVAVAAAALRLGVADAPRRLSIVAIPPAHLLLILCGFLPLSLLSGQLHMLSNNAWARFLEVFPAFDVLEAARQQELLEPLTHASLPVLILIIAVAPALVEELILRGVVGRGLLARWGLVQGVAFTSVLFAVMHIHPPVVLALLPLAVLLHLVYLATRSFLAPVLLHFLNNAFWAVVMALAVGEEVEGIADDKPLPLPLLMSALACVVPICWFIWKTRVRYVLADGSEWTPGYVTAERPPADVPAVRERAAAPAWLLAVTVLGIVQFGAVLVVASQ